MEEKSSLFEKIREKFGGKKLYAVLLAVMILAQAVIVTYYFVFEKENYYADEPWSYGLANSYYDPYLNGVDVRDGSKCEQWTGRGYYENYLTVQRGQRFSYGSVWYNQSQDMHPPLYFALLHTICSFFPDVFSRYFAFVINILAMIAGQIYLYRASSRICRSEVLGLAVCALWGFCCGFVNMNIFLRHYALLTMFTAMLLYCHARLYFAEGSLRANMIRLGIVMVFGALSHHYFLITAFAAAAFFCIYYLCRRDFDTLLAYAGTMAGTVLLSIGIFPATITHMFSADVSNSEGLYLTYKMPLINGIRACVAVIANSMTGYAISPYMSFNHIYAVLAAVIIIAVCVPLCILFRKEEWFKKLTGKAREGIKYFFGHFDFMYLCILTDIIFTLVIVSMFVNINVMQFFTDRYLFHIMPWVAVLLVLTAKYLVFLIKPLRKFTNVIVILLCCAAVVYSNDRCEKRYLFKREAMGEERLISTCSPNSSYVMVIDYYWCIVNYANMLMGCDSSFVTTYESYKEHMDEIAQMDMSKDCYVVIQTKSLRKFEKLKNDGEGNIEGTNMLVEDDDGGAFNDIPTEEEIISDFEENIFPGYKLMFRGSELIMGGYAHTFKLVPESEYVDCPIIDTRILNEGK